MSLLRVFMQTVLTLAQAGQWDILRSYLAAIPQVIAAREGVVEVGTPVDKPIS